MTHHLSSFHVSIAAAVTKSILLWRDATPNVRFPKTDELVKIELGRILGHPRVIENVPGMRAVIGYALSLKLGDEPWNVDPPALLQAFVNSMGTGPMLELAGDEMLVNGHLDATYGMLRRSGNPGIATDADFTKYACQVSKALGISASLRAAVATKTREAYIALHSQLILN